MKRPAMRRLCAGGRLLTGRAAGSREDAGEGKPRPQGASGGPVTWCRLGEIASPGAG